MFRTGVTRLDVALRGGVPPGVAIVCGEAGAGKTAIGASFMREACIAGKTALYVSTSGAPEVAWLGAPEALSVVTGKGPEAVAAALAGIQSGVDLVVIDTMESGYAGSAVLGLSDMSDELNHEAAKMYAGLTKVGLFSLAAAAERVGALAVLLVDTRVNFGRGQRIRANLPAGVTHPVDTFLHVYRVATTSASGTFDYAEIRIEIRRCRHVTPGARVSTRLWPVVGIDSAYEKLMYLTERGVLVRAGTYWKSVEPGISLGPGLTKAVAQMRQGLAGAAEE